MELAPPREAAGGLYTMVFENWDNNEQMIRNWRAQVIGAEKVAAIVKKLFAQVFERD